MTRLTKDFKADFPDATQSGGIRFSARRLQQYIEKHLPAHQEESGGGLAGVYSLPGRGASGESST